MASGPSTTAGKHTFIIILFLKSEDVLEDTVLALVYSYFIRAIGAL